MYFEEDEQFFDWKCSPPPLGLSEICLVNINTHICCISLNFIILSLSKSKCVIILNNALSAACSEMVTIKTNNFWKFLINSSLLESMWIVDFHTQEESALALDLSSPCGFLVRVPNKHELQDCLSWPQSCQFPPGWSGRSILHGWLLLLSICSSPPVLSRRPQEGIECRQVTLATGEEWASESDQKQTLFTNPP